MKKKCLSFTLALILLLGSFALPAEIGFADIGAMPALAAVSSDFSYTYNADGSIVITGYTGTGSSATIPSSIGGKTVSSIGSWAFVNCAGLTKLTLPSSIKTIGDFAFAGCSDLKSMTIPSSVTSIGEYAFYSCYALASVNIGKNVKNIGNSTFAGCAALKSVTIPNSVTSIGEYAFYSCDALTCAIIGENVKTIGMNAFPWNARSNLIVFTMSDAVKSYAKTAQVTCYDPSNWKAFPEARVKTNISRTIATIQWEPIAGAGGYDILRYNASIKKYTKVTTKNASSTTHTLTGLKAGTSYKYRVRAYIIIDGKKYYSANGNLRFRTLSSSSVISSRNAKVDKGYFAEITSKSVKTNNKAIYTSASFYRWAYVSPITQFTDKSGNPGFAYTKGSYLYIAKLSSTQKLISPLKIKMKYPQLGGLVCDTQGYYYVVWGKGDTAGSGGVATVAISKYSGSGKHVKTTPFKTSAGSSETRYPFSAGNCAITLRKGILVCSYARQMYNGHQSNDVIAVYTSSMNKCDDYYSYCSHSFDQRLIFDKNGKAWFADHGDAYPRGFKVNEFTPVHFYADASAMSDMFVLNATNAQLGGIADMSTGVVLVGASVKGMTKSTYGKSKNLFVTYADSSLKMPDGKSRTGICKGESATDTGIKWLTSYSDTYEVQNPQVVATGDDRLVILWEKNNRKKGTFVQSYYMILSSNGKVLQKATPMNKIRLNANEEPIYKSGSVFWVTANGGNAVVRKLNVGSLIAAKKATLSKATSPRAKTVKAVWKKDSRASGYQLQIAKNKSFTSGKKSYAVSKNSTTSKSIAKLIKSTNYYVRVRAYKRIDGKKIYGKWSDYKKIACR